MDVQTLDLILDWQMAIAWSGEGICQPTRLGWWRTDLIDEDGGADLLSRLFPRTKFYAGWEAVRDAAIAVDRRARQRMAAPDEIRTLFFCGFDIDEQLNDRLAERKRLNKKLTLPIDWGNGFDCEALAKQICDRCGSSEYRTVFGGREVINTGTTARNFSALVAALTPWDKEYPMPFYRVED
ncbi:MAG: BREX-6 system BrxE protein [Pseudanabaena frigida]|uniref:BREX-6 system BrxE protein n=1 Tax=Pseudanabaena frigida TaxID=945775 RepID=A0A2W4WJ63_9CYAN|nr:MAG: BREX-6 system BrxE protein [Pseudanabaena frigida]